MIFAKNKYLQVIHEKSAIPNLVESNLELEICEEPEALRVVAVLPVPNTKKGVYIVLPNRRMDRAEIDKYRMRKCFFKKECMGFARKNGMKTRSFSCYVCINFVKK